MPTRKDAPQVTHCRDHDRYVRDMGAFGAKVDGVTAAIEELRKSLKESNDEIVRMFREWRAENAAMMTRVQRDVEKNRIELEGRIASLEKDKSFRDGTDTVKINIENRRPKWASTAVSFASLLLALTIAAGSLVITFVTLRGN